MMVMMIDRSMMTYLFIVWEEYKQLIRWIVCLFDYEVETIASEATVATTAQ
jgi:hypothetical protein